VSRRCFCEMLKHHEPGHKKLTGKEAYGSRCRRLTGDIRGLKKINFFLAFPAPIYYTISVGTANTGGFGLF